MKTDAIIIHYDEIGLKGKNRRQFEQRLISNIQKKLSPIADIDITRETGQLTGRLKESINTVENKHHCEKIISIMSKIPGIAYFCLAQRTGLMDDELKTSVHDIIIEHNNHSPFESFKIDTKRHDKNFPKTSVDINCWLGGVVLDALPDKKVNLTTPDISLKLEITQSHGYISTTSYPSVGGLPTDSRQKVVALLSGGFDSPVAAYMMMKRGCEVIFTHFQNQNQQSLAVTDKIHKLAKQLSCFQIHSQLYMVPFEDLQKKIIINVPPELRMLVYRRCMLDISTQIANNHGAKFLITGDSFSQVASQTFDNLYSTYKHTELPILSPLMGLNKQEIISIARTIGTFEISKLPYGDCCSFFVAKHPMLRSTPEMISSTLKNINYSELLSPANSNITHIKPSQFQPF